MRQCSARQQNGYSFIELLLVISIAATLTGVAVPRVSGTIDDLRAAGAPFATGVAAPSSLNCAGSA